jgi:hypothetical protein
LATADQTNNNAPTLVAIHHTDQKLGLRHVEVNVTALSLHEPRSLIAGPCSLRLIEHHNTLVGWGTIPQRLIPKMVNVLNEACAAACPGFSGVPRRDVYRHGRSDWSSWANLIRF